MFNLNDLNKNKANKPQNIKSKRSSLIKCKPASMWSLRQATHTFCFRELFLWWVSLCCTIDNMVWINNLKISKENEKIPKYERICVGTVQEQVSIERLLKLKKNYQKGKNLNFCPDWDHVTLLIVFIDLLISIELKRIQIVWNK